MKLVMILMTKTKTKTILMFTGKKRLHRLWGWWCYWWQRQRLRLSRCICLTKFGNLDQPTWSPQSQLLTKQICGGLLKKLSMLSIFQPGGACNEGQPSRGSCPGSVHQNHHHRQHWHWHWSNITRARTSSWAINYINIQHHHHHHHYHIKIDIIAHATSSSQLKIDQNSSIMVSIKTFLIGKEIYRCNKKVRT